MLLLLAAVVAVVYQVRKQQRQHEAAAAAAAAEIDGMATVGMVDNPMSTPSQPAAGLSGAASVGGGSAPPSHGGDRIVKRRKTSKQYLLRSPCPDAASNIVYAVPLEDGRPVVPRVPNLLYQSADGPPNDRRSLVQVPNVMYEPAANNAYDAGVNSNANRNSATTATGNGAAASNNVYATPFEDGRLVVPRVPNPLYQSTDGPPNDGRSLVRVPNVIYEPAANNASGAGGGEDLCTFGQFQGAEC